MFTELISIITPSLNSAHVIADCIRTVVAQGPSVEHLVVDGASTDNTLGVIANHDSNVRVITEPPSGIYTALNAGITASKGSILGVLHADDFYASSEVLSRVRAAFDDPQVNACYSDLCYVDRNQTDRVVRYWKAGESTPRKLLNGWMPPHPTFFVRRKVYEEFGLYRTDLGTAADYEIMVRLLVKHGINAVYIPEVLVHMRTGGVSNASLSARFHANRMDRKAWKVNGLRPYPWTTIAKPLRKIGQWWSRPG